VHDSGIIKALKGIYNKGDLDFYIKDDDDCGGITYQLFILDFIREVYLKNTEKFLTDLLRNKDLAFEDLEQELVNDIFRKYLDDACASMYFANYKGLSRIVDVSNKQLDRLRELVDETEESKRENKAEKNLKEVLNFLG
jgi:hypothetical protein